MGIQRWRPRTELISWRPFRELDELQRRFEDFLPAWPVSRRFPFEDTDWVPAARFQIAEVHYKEKKYDQAKEEYQGFLQDFPGHKLAEKAKKRVSKIESKLSPKE